MGEQLGDATIVGLAGYRSAAAQVLLGRYADADASATESLEAFASLSEPVFRFGGLPHCFVGSFQAIALAELGRFEDAEAVGLKSYRDAVQAKHGYTIAIACFGIAHAYLLRGRVREALPILSDGMDHIAAHGLLAGEPWVASRFAYALALTGDGEKAREMVETSRSPTVVSSSMRHGFAQLFSARALLALGDHAGAREFVDLAREQAAQCHEVGVNAWAQWLLGELAMQGDKPDPSAARDFYQNALDAGRTLSMLPLEAHAQLGIGEAATALGDTDGALAMLTEARDQAAAIHLDPVMGRAGEGLTMLG